MEDFLAALDGDIEGLRSLLCTARRHNSVGTLRWLLEVMWRDMSPIVAITTPSVHAEMDQRFEWWGLKGQLFEGATFHATPIDEKGSNAWSLCKVGFPKREGPYLFSGLIASGKREMLSETGRRNLVCKACLRQAALEYLDPKPLTLEQMEEDSMYREDAYTMGVKKGFREELVLSPKEAVCLIPPYWRLD